MSSEAHATTGSWMLALMEAIRIQPGVDLAVTCVYPRVGNDKQESSGVLYYSIPRRRKKRLFHFSDIDGDPSLLEQCIDVIRDWQPDLIHIHGTERFYGLLTASIPEDIPVVISIQGLLTECCKWRHTFGDLSIKDVALMHSPLRFLRGIGLFWDYRRMLKSAMREQTIIRSNKHFMGRTDWDHAHIKAINPDARYYHVDELLRPEFSKQQWDLNSCQRHSIVFTNAREPRRGVDALFQAVVLLKKRFADVKVKLAGADGFDHGYGKHLARLAQRKGISNNVEFLGFLNAENMSRALASSHAFVLSSLIENSPNSLCEAQAVGMPCVASYTGGVPSLISNGKTGLMVPVGDSSMIAERVTQIFENNDLAEQLGKSAKQIAMARHDPEKITERLLYVYEDVIDSRKMT